MTSTGSTATLFAVSPADWSCLVALSEVNEALTDSDLAYQHSCAPDADRWECNCPDLPNPPKESAFRLLDVCLRRVVPAGVVDQVWVLMRNGQPFLDAVTMAGVRSS